MVIRPCHAAHHLPVSSHEAWDSQQGKHGYGRNTDLSQPTTHSPDPVRLQATRATNLRVLLHDMRIGTGQVQHMP